MSSFQITCTTKSPRTWQGHHHIVSVGLRGEVGTFTVQQIYRLMDSGHRFYTVSPSSGRTALVRKYRCCNLDTLRSDGDVVYDNNLDYLPSCR
jgi:uncharacterized protein (DUF1684 family)